MTIQDLKEYLEKRVQITTRSGKVFKGVITGLDNGFDTNSSVDEVELDVGSYYEGIEIPDIIDIKPT